MEHFSTETHLQHLHLRYVMMFDLFEWQYSLHIGCKSDVYLCFRLHWYITILFTIQMSLVKHYFFTTVLFYSVLQMNLMRNGSYMKSIYHPANRKGWATPKQLQNYNIWLHGTFIHCCYEIFELISVLIKRFLII